MANKKKKENLQSFAAQWTESLGEEANNAHASYLCYLFLSTEDQLSALLSIYG